MFEQIYLYTFFFRNLPRVLGRALSTIHGTKNPWHEPACASRAHCSEGNSLRKRFATFSRWERAKRFRMTSLQMESRCRDLNVRDSSCPEIRLVSSFLSRYRLSVIRLTSLTAHNLAMEAMLFVTVVNVALARSSLLAISRRHLQHMLPKEEATVSALRLNFG